MYYIQSNADTSIMLSAIAVMTFRMFVAALLSVVTNTQWDIAPYYVWIGISSLAVLGIGKWSIATLNIMLHFVFFIMFMPLFIGVASVQSDRIQYPIWIGMILLARLWRLSPKQHEIQNPSNTKGMYSQDYPESSLGALIVIALIQITLWWVHLLFPILVFGIVHFFDDIWGDFVVVCVCVLFMIEESENIRKNVETCNKLDNIDGNIVNLRYALMFRQLKRTHRNGEIGKICNDIQKLVIYHPTENKDGMCSFKDVDSFQTVFKFILDHIMVFVYTLVKYVLVLECITTVFWYTCGMIVFGSFLMNACMIIDFYFMGALHIVYVIYATIGAISVVIYVVVGCIWNSRFRLFLWLMTVLFVCTSCMQFVHKKDILHDSPFSKNTVFVGCDKTVKLTVDGTRSCWHADNNTFETNDTLSFVTIVRTFPRGSFIYDGDVYDKYTIPGMRFNEHGLCPVWNVPVNGTQIECNKTRMKRDLFEKPAEFWFDMVFVDMTNWRNRFNQRSSKFMTDDYDDVSNQLIHFVNKTTGIMTSEWLANTTIYYTHEAVAWAIVSNYSLF